MLQLKSAAVSPFHEGEIALQKSVGVADHMAEVGRRVIRDYMPEQHREFYRQLPFVVLGSVDSVGDTWVTLLSGRPGFLSSPDPKTLAFAVAFDPQDPATVGLGTRSAVGMLGIELHSRRRNRMDGIIGRRHDGGFDVEVEHTVGNCPRYIQLRDYEFVRDPSDHAFLPKARATDLADPKVRALIDGADTFFVSSYIDGETGRQVDASHRGGKPGFVRINDDGTLTIPDFAGNLLFNTLGNFLLNPKAGLAFPDFETGDMLQLTGDAEVVFESDEIDAFQGAERLWVFRPRKAILRPDALPLRFKLQPTGQHVASLLTGDWAQTAARLEAEALKTQWRPFRIARLVDESSVIRSFDLEPADGKGIVVHQAGQYLPIRLVPDGESKPVVRSYTISTAPSDGRYRISVKRQGVVSNHLHSRLVVGDLIEVRAPAGGFMIDALERRPAVLLAAGVGITPMLAMLRSIVYEGLRKQRIRPAWMFVAAHTLAERAFDAEISSLVAQAVGAIRLVRVLGDASGAVKGKDYDAVGRIDINLLGSVLPFGGYDFFMCGPPSFTQGLYNQLRDAGTPDARIYAEAFGPASLDRSHDQSMAVLPPPSRKSVPVTFVKSGKEARWEPGSAALLELAEGRGLSPDYGCRSGSCGACATKILAGKVTYAAPPQAKVDGDAALICCAVPADASAGGSDRLILDL